MIFIKTIEPAKYSIRITLCHKIRTSNIKNNTGDKASKTLASE